MLVPQLLLSLFVLGSLILPYPLHKRRHIVYKKVHHPPALFVHESGLGQNAEMGKPRVLLPG